MDLWVEHGRLIDMMRTKQLGRYFIMKIDLEGHEPQRVIGGGSVLAAGFILGLFTLGVAVYDIDRIADAVEEVTFTMKKKWQAIVNGEEKEITEEEEVTKEVPCKECPACEGNKVIKEECKACGGDYESKEECEACKGKGKKTNDCSECDGTGNLDVGGIISECGDCEGSGTIEVECEDCDGNGYILNICPKCNEGYIEEDCDECSGTGYVSDEDAINAIIAELEYEEEVDLKYKDGELIVV